MTSYKEILRLHSLGINKTQIAGGSECSRTTVTKVLKAATERGISWRVAEEMSEKELS